MVEQRGTKWRYFSCSFGHHGVAALYDILDSAQHKDYLAEDVVVDDVFDGLVLEDVVDCFVCDCLLG